MMDGFDRNYSGFAPLAGTIEQAASDAGTEYALLLRIRGEVQALARKFDGIRGCGRFGYMVI